MTDTVDGTHDSAASASTTTEETASAIARLESIVHKLVQHVIDDVTHTGERYHGQREAADEIKKLQDDDLFSQK